MNYFYEVIELNDSQRMIETFFYPGWNKLFYRLVNSMFCGKRCTMV